MDLHKINQSIPDPPCGPEPYKHGSSIIRHTYQAIVQLLRRDIVNIVPPLGRKGCEDSVNDLQRMECEGTLNQIRIIAVCVAAGVLVLAITCFLLMTLFKWIRAVRPTSQRRFPVKQAKLKGVKTTRRDGLMRDGSQLTRSIWVREEVSDEEGGRSGENQTIASSFEEKRVWYGGVKLLLPWGSGRNWTHAVLRVPRIGVSRGMLIGMDASSVTTIDELGELERGNRHPSQSSSSISNDERGQGTGRVVSGGRETATGRKGNSINKEAKQSQGSVIMP